MATTTISMSSGQSQSQSNPSVINTPQSDWEFQLAQYLQSLGQEQSQWAMQQYAKMGGVTDAQINNYIQTAQQGSDMAGSLAGRYSGLYGPMEDQYAREAGSYASNGRIQHEMGAAESDVMQAGRKGEINAEQELQSFGIDPSSGRYQDLVQANKTKDAAAAAGAGETARRTVEAEGQRRKVNAIQMGQQLPGAAVNALNSTYQGIAGAANTAMGAANTGVNLTTSPSKFLDPAMNLKYPPVGQVSTSRSNQGSSSGSSGGGGSGGGGSGNRDPFNSDRFGRSSGQNPGLPNDSRGAVPAYSNPRGGATMQNPNAGVRTIPGQTVAGQDSPYGPWDPGLEGMGGQSGTYPDPWNDTQSPYDWGQGGSGIQPTNDTSLGNPNDPWGSTPAAPDGWSQGTTDGSMQGQGWWGGTPQANWDGGGQSQDQGVPSYGGQYDSSGWGNSSGYDPSVSAPQSADWGSGSWDNNGGGSDYQDYGGSSGSDNYYARGGSVGGGQIPAQMSPSGGRQTDDVAATIPQTGGRAQLNVGEFVMPKDVVAWKGHEFFQKMIAQSRKARMGAPAKPQRG